MKTLKTAVSLMSKRLIHMYIPYSAVPMLCIFLLCKYAIMNYGPFNESMKCHHLKGQKWDSCSKARVILEQVLSIVACESQNHTDVKACD